MMTYTLYGYFRSSCSARLRIALNLKAVTYEQVPINLLRDEQSSEQHKAMNPSASVPLLVCHDKAYCDFAIGQSISALEFLDEVHSHHPLLPRGDPKARAVVRTLVFIITSDLQPVTNLRILRRVRNLGGNVEAWNQDLIGVGFEAYEAAARNSAGKFSVGDHLTLADVCLVLAVWNVRRFGVNIGAFPTIERIMEELETHPEVIEAGYSNQPDTPEELR